MGVSPVYNKRINEWTSKAWLFAPSSPILANNYLPLNEALCVQGVSMYKVLFLIVLTFSFSVAAKQPDLLSVIKAHQELLNNGNTESALKHWLPSKREKLTGVGLNAIASIFSGLELVDSSIKQSCNQKQCKVTAIATKAGQQSEVVYILVKIDSVFYLSNIQTKNT
jgi:hypothetical protein